MGSGRIGHLFPAGGPVPPDLVIGRLGDIEEIRRRLREGIHTMLTGDRRIGKTTVCDAVCDRMGRQGAVIVQIEVPERNNSASLLQLVVDRSTRVPLAAKGRKAIRAARPLIQKVLSENGIPLDLDQLDAEPTPRAARAILSLPATLARATRRPVVLYLDELQRAVDYVDGPQILGDLVDLYSGTTDVVLLVDGSDQRVLDGMLGNPIRFGKLCDLEALPPTIPSSTWKEGLPARFHEAGLDLGAAELTTLMKFGEGRPYATMAAARYAALNARKLGSERVGAFETEEGVAEAQRHLDDDG